MHPPTPFLFFFSSKSNLTRFQVKNERQRNKVAFEVLETEKTYVTITVLRVDDRVLIIFLMNSFAADT